MDEYEHLTDAQWQLYHLMGEISEDCFCASWLGDSEYDIWHALQHSDPWPTNRHMSPRLLRLCQKLSNEIDGWIYWAGGPKFAPMAQWLAMVQDRHMRAARLAQMQEAQAMVRQHVPASLSLVDDLITDRRTDDEDDTDQPRPIEAVNAPK